MIHALAAAQGRRQQLSPSSFRRWFTTFDTFYPPMPGLHTMEVTTREGGFRVFPGGFEDECWLLEHLLETGRDDDRLPTAFRHALLQTALAALRLSEAVAERAGLARNLQTEHRPGQPTIPSGARRRRLLHAVTFINDELEDVCGTEGRAALDALTSRPSDYGSAALDDDPLFGQPMIDFGDTRIIAAADFLVRAACRHIVNLALEKDCIKSLADVFRDIVVHCTFESLARLGLFFLEPLPTPNVVGDFARVEALFRFDRDKVLHLLILSDDFSGYDTNQPKPVWDTLPTSEKLQERLDDVARMLFSDTQPPNEVLHLIVVQGYGRSFPLALSPYGSTSLAHRVVFSASELDLFARIEETELLALWRFAVSVDEVRARFNIAPVSQLEEYAFLRDSDWRFEPENTPEWDLISLMGFAGEMRAEWVLRRDPHAAPSPSGDKWVTVIRRVEDGYDPVYILDIPTAVRSPGVLFEAGSFCLWSLPSSGAVPLDRWVSVENWTNLVAYWLTQLQPAVQQLFDELSRSVTRILVRLTVPEPTMAVAASGDPWVVKLSPPDTIDVEVRPAALQLLSGPDNSGEQEFAAAILHSLGLLAGGKWSRMQAQDLVRQYGTDKRNLKFSSIDDPAFVPTGMPDRTVSDWNQTRIRRLVGRHLQDTGLISEEPQPTNTEVLKEAVSRAYKGLEELVASLSPSGLLEFLINFHEELLYQQARASVDTPLQAQSLGDVSTVVSRAVDMDSASREGSVAIRFLIEYVAAQPPAGLRPISFSVYDELLATAAFIVRVGTLSDLRKYELDEPIIAVTPDGTFIDLTARYGQAIAAFLQGTWQDWVGREGPPLQPMGTADSEEVTHEEQRAENDERLDAAIKEETGVSLSEQARLRAALLDLAVIEGQGAQVLPLNSVVHDLAAITGWSKRSTLHMIESLALKPRPNFLSPSRDCHPRDVYPWRFNRALSYLRRPLIIRSHDDKDELVFGPRHLMDSWRYLNESLYSGRYPASSTALKQCISTIQQRAAVEFNDEVADVYEQVSHLRVRRRMNKVAGKRLLDERGDVGDIDVLVIDTRAHLLLCIETKRLAGAAIAHQVANELRETFSISLKHPSAVERHLRRIRYVKQNKQAVLQDLGLNETFTWQIEGLVVTDREILSAHVSRSPLPVRSIHAISRALRSGHLC